MRGGCESATGHSPRPVQIFLLYTLCAPEPGRLGLGQVDSNSDHLEVTVHLQSAHQTTEVCAVDAEEQESLQPGRAARKTARAKGSRDNGPRRGNSEQVQVRIRQDSTSLRSTGGDTGSVVWRSSVYLAGKLLRDMRSAERGRTRHASEPASCLLAPSELAECRVLELGSGTGVLPALLLSHPFFSQIDRRMRWLATDQTSMLPLLRRNLGPFPHAYVEGLDWVEASKIYQSQSSSSSQAFLRDMLGPLETGEDERLHPDIIMATDCVFNPHLFAPFVNTLNLCSVPHRTLVVVVCELREPEAMTRFLHTWLDEGEKGERWSVHTMEGEDVVGTDLVRGSVVWVAWRLS